MDGPAYPQWATARRTAWAAAALVVVLIALNLVQAKVFSYADVRLLDLRLGYTQAEVVELFDAYGPGGRRAYAVALAVDSVYPLALLAAVVLAGARAFGNRRWLWIAPTAFAVLDVAENALFALALRAHPDVPLGLVSTAAPLTIVKLASFPPTVGVGLVALAVLTRRCLVRPRPGTLRETVQEDPVG